MYSLVNALKKNDPEGRRLKVRDRLWDVGWMIGRASGKEEIGLPRTLDPTITQSDAREIVEGMRREFGFGSVDSFEKAVRIYCEHFEKKVPT
ncbi:MAG: hypothetical protein KatS3mg087_0354 [Patescibacteria group bacterium]|nr:MAG: hypothetical protein KatS3mg087_0354 [Patescibacteria group bacterium]